MSKLVVYVLQWCFLQLQFLLHFLSHAMQLGGNDASVKAMLHGFVGIL